MVKSLSEKTRKDLMLGLIYPAVLGSIIFLLISRMFEQITIILTHQYHFNWPLTLKFILLLITLGFYLCDYMYITFTNDFEKMFFWFDVIFILDLYCTIYLIHIVINGDNTPPNARWILASYFVFMILYLIWDTYEKNRIKGDERALYEDVIIWEYWAMATLLICFALTFVPAIAYYVGELFFIPLAIITAFFAKYTYKKRRFYRLPEYEKEYR